MALATRFSSSAPGVGIPRAGHGSSLEDRGEGSPDKTAMYLEDSLNVPN